MKKVTSKTLSLVLVLNLLLTSCGDVLPQDIKEEAEKIVEAASSKEEAAKEEKIRETSPSEGSLGTLIEKEGTMTNVASNEEIPYRYIVPKILDDSKDADIINRDIEEKIGKRANEAYFAVNRGENPPTNNISYKATWHDSLVSIVIEEYFSEIRTDRYIYNYDFKTKNSLSSREMLTYLGISQKEFIHQLDAALLRLFDEYPEGGYKERGAMVAYENLNHRNIDIYLSDDRIMAKVVMPDYATGEGRFVYIEIDPDPSYESNKTVEDELLTAELKDNGAYITFKRSENSDEIIPDHIEYGVPYEIDGFLLNYKDIFLGHMGEEKLPGLFLLDSDGSVSFCDIDSCLKLGNKFFGKDKLPGTENTVSLKQGENSHGSTVIKVDNKNEETDLYDIIAKSKKFKVEEISKDSVFSSEHGNYSFIFKDTEDSSFIFRNVKGDYEAEGHFFYSGLTSKGYVYPFCMWTDENSYASGFFTVSYSIGSYKAENLSVTFLNFTDLPAMPETEKAITFSLIEEVDSKEKDVNENDLHGSWATGDKVTFLNLKDGNIALYEIKGIDGSLETSYEGTWKKEDSTFTLSLEFSEGTPLKKMGHDVDFVDGTYGYTKAYDGSLIIVPLDNASPLSESQKFKKNFPEAFYHHGSELNSFEKSEEQLKIEEASKKYANSRGIRANNADVMCSLDDGLLIRVYQKDNDITRTKAWYLIDPSSGTGKEYSSNKVIDIDDFI